MAKRNEQWLQKARDWYHNRGWQAFPFQEEMACQYLSGKNGLLNAPTGSGKTMAMWILPLLEALKEQEKGKKFIPGLRVIWITPLRALAKDIVNATQSAAKEMGLPWRIESRTGDTASSRKTKQRKQMPVG